MILPTTDSTRVVSAAKTADDAGLEPTLRPSLLAEFTGQRQSCDNLRTFVNAAKRRNEALDHVLLFGPPGLGKTTLAQIVANEMEVNFHATSGPVIQRSGDLVALLSRLNRGDVLFIDEIHRLQPMVEEFLYTAMEDYQIDLVLGAGAQARAVVRYRLMPFTLVGATTRSGLLTRPLRERFGIPLRLEFYTADELKKVLERAAIALSVELSPEGAFEIAKRSRGTPRIALRLLRRIRDFAENGLVDAHLADAALRQLDVDASGLDAMDRRYLRLIGDAYNGGPVGVDTLAAALGDERDVVEDVIEPYLLQGGFVERTSRGRSLTDKARRHLGKGPRLTVVNH